MKTTNDDLQEKMKEILFDLHIRRCEPAEETSNNFCNSFKDKKIEELTALVEEEKKASFAEGVASTVYEGMQADRSRIAEKAVRDFANYVDESIKVDSNRHNMLNWASEYLKHSSESIKD